MTDDFYGTHYQVLGVGVRATREDIDEAYFQLARKYHPDVAGDAPEVVAKFARINEAYLILADPAERGRYDEEIADTMPWEPAPVVVTAEKPPGDADSPEPAGKTAPKARPSAKPRPGGAMDPGTLARIKSVSSKLIREGDFWKSGDLLNKAALAFPRDPDVRRLQARAAQGRGRLREAAEYLKHACEAEYFNPENHLLLGRVYMKADQLQLARKSFENALSWQEDHEEALKALGELRKLESKKAPIWKRLFGGKS